MSEDRELTSEPSGDGNRIEPLPGEAGIPDVASRRRTAWSAKGLLAVALLLVSIIAVAAYWLQRLASGGGKPEELVPQVRDRPAAATAVSRRLEMPQAVPSAPSAAASASGPRIPAIVATPEELAEPIGVRRTGTASPGSSPGGKPPVAPEDAPVMVLAARPGATARPAGMSAPPGQAGEDSLEGNGASGGDDTLDGTRRNLQAYQRQLQGMLDRLTSTASGVPGAAPSAGLLGGIPPGPPLPGTPTARSPAPGNLFGGQLQGSATPRVSAGMLGDRSLTLPKGTVFTCALKTRVVSATSGFIGCQVQRNVYSDDGRVLLVERGSHLDGEYRATSIRPGTVRIPVLWTRVRTPHGVTVDIESPGTGQLGESGIDGYVDNRWVERIGAAMLVSLINDTVQLVIQTQTNEGSGDTIIFPSTTASTSKLAEKVLESTINIPPLIYQNQGGIVGIYVARDVDFSSVYELKPVAR
ncbi:MAG: type IV secretion system protein VirB10 [Rubrivivax sp.]|nr:type IV secretion system protein VirB10 [Rubrivivax sp.]